MGTEDLFTSPEWKKSLATMQKIISIALMEGLGTTIVACAQTDELYQALASLRRLRAGQSDALAHHEMLVGRLDKVTTTP